MNAKKKIKAAKISLMKDSPFFSYLVVKMNAERKENIKTMGVNQMGTLFYNPEFVNSINKEKLKGVLCHEVLHLGLEHELRRNNRSHKGWNVAADYAVNAIVKRNKFKLPEKALYDEKYSKMPAESIYEDIRGNIQKQGGQQSEEGDGNNSQNSQSQNSGSGSEEDTGTQPAEGKVKVGSQKGDQFDRHPKAGQKSAVDKEKVKKKSQEWKDEMAAAAQYAKQQGSMPGGMKRVLDELFEQKLNWKQILRKYISRSIPVDYTYSRPRKQYYSTGTYLPKVKKEGTDLVVAVDTSGSIGNKELKKFGSEINGILQSHQGVSMELLIGDYELSNHKKIDRFTKKWYKDINWEGGNGTDHKWIFRWVRENSPRAKLIICFTDGYTSFPDSSKVRTDTLWVSTKLKPKEYPFGKAVRFDPNA